MSRGPTTSLSPAGALAVLIGSKGAIAWSSITEDVKVNEVMVRVPAGQTVRRMTDQRRISLGTPRGLFSLGSVYW